MHVTDLSADVGKLSRLDLSFDGVDFACLYGDLGFVAQCEV